MSAMRPAKDSVNPHGLQLLAEPLRETFRFLQFAMIQVCITKVLPQ